MSSTATHVEPDTVSCPICCKVQQVPYFLDCSCRRSFCRLCIQKWHAAKQTCPVCNTESGTDPIMCCRGWMDVVNSVKRPCTNSSKCKKRKMCYRDMCEHEQDECGFRKVACVNTDCMDLVDFKDLSEHLKTCPLKRCPNYGGRKSDMVYGCPVMGTIRQIDMHMKNGECLFHNERLLAQLRALTGETQIKK